jgi:segregation and condensation protein B
MDSALISKQIEAILFHKAEPIPKKDIIKILEIDEKTFSEALEYLHKRHDNSGLSIIDHDDTIALTTSNQVSNTVEKITREEISKDIGKAGLETLTIILYLGPITRSEIEFIRGVNCQFILRNLLMRGLVDREEDQKDNRVYKYTASIDLLRNLGISSTKELSDIEEVRNKIEAIRNQDQEIQNK